MAKQSVTVTVNGTRYQRDIEPRLGYKSFDEVIHRDNLVIL